MSLPPPSCYPGTARTRFLVQQRFWWPTLLKDVKEFVSACPICAQFKPRLTPPAGLLHPLPIPRRPWSHISIDFVTGLPPSNVHTTILTVVDRFSKMVHFIPLPKLPSAKETADVLIQHVFRLPETSFPTGVPSSPPNTGQSSAGFWESPLACLPAFNPKRMGNLNA